MCISLSNNELTDYYVDIDELLGNKGERFFGEGFKQVTYQVFEQHVNSLCDVFNAKVNISYSKVWSQKGEKSLTPHLSTVDAVWFNCYGCEQLLSSNFDMSENITTHLFRSIEIKAGSSPEEELNNINLSVRLINTIKIKGFYPYSSTFEVEIGGMRLRTIIEHGCGEIIKNSEVGLIEIDKKCSFAYTRECERTINKNTYHKITNVGLRRDFKYIQGRMKSLQEISKNTYFISPIEVIISLAQLAQVIIYKNDKLYREKSETLWMRYVLLENLTQCYDMNGCLATVWMDKEKSIYKNGDVWRMYRMLGTLGSSRCTYSLAHKLPPKKMENT